MTAGDAESVLLAGLLDYLGAGAADAVAECLRKGLAPGDPWLDELARDHGLSAAELKALLEPPSIPQKMFRIASARLAGQLLGSLRGLAPCP